MAFSSKYSVSLYEHISQWTGLSRKSCQDLTLEEFRDLLGVEEGKYAAFGALNKHVIKQTVMELNALASFSVTVVPVKTGKRVTHIRVGWWQKEKDELDAAWREVHRSKVGRKARIAGTATTVTDPYPSQNRLARKGRGEVTQLIDDSE